MGRLEGKVALVTGGSRGIGAAIARAFAHEGARVAITYRTHAQVASALARELPLGLAVPLDIGGTRSDEPVRRAVQDVITHYGQLDLLVNNAGSLQQKDFFEITNDDFAQAIDVNLKGPFVATQEAGKHMRKRASGCILNIASIGAQIGGPKAPHYAAAKAALITFTRSCARLLAPHGVRVNAIAPGFVRTAMIAHVLAGEGEANIARDIPLGRIGEPADVAAAAVYLASEESAFVTGQVLSVNGGQWMG
jgi:NAD(P)-dependent dehydrogenase (short-subunit alcohol dehydrogenase family)